MTASVDEIRRLGCRVLPHQSPPDTASHIAIALSSALVGLLFVWTLVRAIVPNVAEWALLLRYLVYAISLAIFYRTCDISREGASVPFAAFSGLSAAACTASPYLLIWGIPVLWVLCGIAWFRIGYGVAACWGLMGEGLNRKIALQNIALSKTVLATTAAILFGIVANVLLGGGLA